MFSFKIPHWICPDPLCVKGCDICPEQPLYICLYHKTAYLNYSLYKIWSSCFSQEGIQVFSCVAGTEKRYLENQP